MAARRPTVASPWMVDDEARHDQFTDGGFVVANTKIRHGGKTKISAVKEVKLHAGVRRSGLTVLYSQLFGNCQPQSSKRHRKKDAADQRYCFCSHTLMCPIHFLSRSIRLPVMPAPFFHPERVDGHASPVSYLPMPHHRAATADPP